MPNFVSLPCPECEGVGKQVNYFDIPKPPDFFVRLNLSSIREEPYIQRRSDGREYYDYECSVCKGSRQVTIFLPPGINKEDLVVINHKYAIVRDT